MEAMFNCQFETMEVAFEDCFDEFEEEEKTMKNFTTHEKIAGGLAVAKMSDKAQIFYYNTDPLNVWKRDGMLYTDWADDYTPRTFDDMEALLEYYFDLYAKITSAFMKGVEE